jgi:hypothetical protein
MLSNRAYLTANNYYGKKKNNPGPHPDTAEATGYKKAF